MLFILMATDMMEEEVVWVHLLNIGMDSCEYWIVIVNGVMGVHRVIESVDAFDNPSVVAVHMYRPGCFQGKGVEADVLMILPHGYQPCPFTPGL